jgi:hypothetical protein
VIVERALRDAFRALQIAATEGVTGARQFE